jgi:hypothetical protein
MGQICIFNYLCMGAGSRHYLSMESVLLLFQQFHFRGAAAGFSSQLYIISDPPLSARPEYHFRRFSVFYMPNNWEHKGAARKFVLRCDGPRFRRSDFRFGTQFDRATWMDDRGSVEWNVQGLDRCRNQPHRSTWHLEVGLYGRTSQFGFLKNIHCTDQFNNISTHYFDYYNCTWQRLKLKVDY